jgi:nitroimidazol reductase NimA-like FMN-containing flavoprotein (pyridoxamine 5'-phosphate oxidase superfamily)
MLQNHAGNMSERSPDALAPHRTCGHLGWELVDARLRALREVWVATSDALGRPDAVPVWFWWEGTVLYFSTHPESAKARNLTQQPDIVAHNGDGAEPIIIRGTAEPVQDSAELARADAAYRAKYIDPHSGTEAPLFGLDTTPALVFRVRPRLISAWAYADYATRTDWRFDDAA